MTQAPTEHDDALPEDEPLPEDDLTILPEPPSRLKPWMAALASRRIPFMVTWRQGRKVIVVRQEHADAALAELDDYCARNEGWPPPSPAPQSKAPLVTNPALFAAALVITLLAMLHSRVAASPDFWHVRGAWDYQLVRAGEWWRLVTSLTLHADQAHLFANLGWIATLLCLLASEIGAGTATLLMLLSGILGNLGMLALGSDHRSIGASTMVFGLIGILCAVRTIDALRVRARTHCALLKILPWTPLGAGVAIFALYGSAPGSDILAHFCGFGAGLLLSATAVPLRRLSASKLLQAALATIAAILLTGAWRLALHD